MTILRASIVSSVAVVLGVVLVQACGGGGSNNNGSGGGPKMCAPANTNCTQAEQNAYSNCVTTACDTQYKECLGPNYRSGNFSGACGTYIQCFNACACNDTACFVACGQPDTACQTCLLSFTSCSASCTVPACYTSGGGTGGTSGGGGNSGSGGNSGGGGSGGGLTCADLLTCCNTIADANAKAQCIASAAAGEQFCGQILTGLRQAGVCN